MVILPALLVFIVPAVLLTILEKCANPVATDWWRNLQAWALNRAAAWPLAVLVPIWSGGALLDLGSLPLWLAIAIYVLLADALEFAFHVAQHRVPSLWALHALHHSDPEMTALTTNRHFWGDQAIKTLTIWSLLAMVIVPKPEYLVAYQLISTYNFFSHANLRVNFGRWSWILNSPAYHRRHHSRLEEHHESNYAAIFPIWDVLMGSYRRPEGWPPCGLADQAPSSLGDLIIWPFKGQRARPGPPLLP